MKRKTASKLPVLGIILGDHAGIGPEIVAKAISKMKGEFVPVLIGNRGLFERATKKFPLPIDLETAAMTGGKPAFSGEAAGYFVDLPAGKDLRTGKVSADSGKLAYDSIAAGVALHAAGKADGLVMAPITKQSLRAAGMKYSSEFEVFADLYKVSGVRSVIKCDDIFRSTVVGHLPFVKIVENLSTERIVETAKGLLGVMRMFLAEKNCRIAVAALNPHAGEDGLFGTEEAEIIAPAVRRLREEGIQVIGPCPADTVFLKARGGEVGGIVYLYHDQGNIAMKSSFFGDGVLIYTGIPGRIVSVGHGSALDIAGKGTADAKNIIAGIETLLMIVSNNRGGGRRVKSVFDCGQGGGLARKTFFVNKE